MKYIILPIWLAIVIFVRLFMTTIYLICGIIYILSMMIWNLKFKKEWVDNFYNKGLDDLQMGELRTEYKRPKSYWDYIINGLEEID